MSSREPQVTAQWIDQGRIYYAPAVNPGEWYGKTWCLGVYCSNAGWPRYIVEADTLAVAIEIFAESEKFGHIVAIDVALDGDCFGTPFLSGIARTDAMHAMGVKAAKKLGIPESDLWITLQGDFVAGEHLGLASTTGTGVVYDRDAITEDTSRRDENRDIPFPVTYHAPGFPSEGIDPSKYGQWYWDTPANRFVPYPEI